MTLEKVFRAAIKGIDYKTKRESKRLLGELYQERDSYTGSLFPVNFERKKMTTTLKPLRDCLLK